jgi:hypothetical protein
MRSRTRTRNNVKLLYQITKLANSPEERDLVVAITGKVSAQRFIAVAAERGDSDRYRLSCFEHPEFNFER